MPLAIDHEAMTIWLLLLIWTAQAVGVPASRPAVDDARRQFFSRHFHEAETALRGLIHLEPANVAARYLLVRTLIEDNRARQALLEAETTLRELPKKALSKDAYGDARLRLADFDRASAAYQEAIRLNPNEPRAHLGIGRVLFSDFRFRSAKEHFRTASGLDPTDPDIALALSSVMAPSAERTRLEEQFADRATYRDPEEREGTKAFASLSRLKGGRRPFAADRLEDAVLIRLEGMPPQSTRPAAFVLEVALNSGESRRLLLDTGAHGILVSPGWAQAGSVERLVPYRLGGLGDAGRAAASLGWADSITIDGKLVVRDCPVIMTDAGTGPMWQGIIGMDVLREFLIDLDFPHNLLRIERASQAGGEDYSWDRPSEADPGAIPVRLVEGKLLVKTSVNGAGAGYFVLDTGASQTLIDRALGGETVSKLKSSRRRIGGISGEVQEVLRSEELLLQFAGLEHRRSLTAVDLSRLSNALGVEIGGLIGCDLLRDLSLSVDYRNGFIRVQSRQ